MAIMGEVSKELFYKEICALQIAHLYWHICRFRPIPKCKKNHCWRHI